MSLALSLKKNSNPLHLSVVAIGKGSLRVTLDYSRQLLQLLLLTTTLLILKFCRSVLGKGSRRQISYNRNYILAFVLFLQTEWSWKTNDLKWRMHADRWAEGNHMTWKKEKKKEKKNIFFIVSWRFENHKSCRTCFDGFNE